MLAAGGRAFIFNLNPFGPVIREDLQLALERSNPEAGRLGLAECGEPEADAGAKEVQRILFQGGDLDDTMVCLRHRGWPEAKTLSLLWKFQASWRQRCQDRMILDFNKLGKNPKPGRLPWDQEN